MSISKLYNRLKNPKLTEAINYCLLFLIGVYFFAKLVFDRPGYTLALNGVLILIILGSAFRLFINFENEKKFLKNLFPVLIVLILSFVSNIINKIFSYHFLLLSLIISSAYLLGCTFENKKKWELLITAMVTGFAAGLFVILFHYRSSLLSSVPLGHDQYFLNMDGLAFCSCSLSCMAFVLVIMKAKDKSIILPIIYILIAGISMFAVIKTLRIGSIIFLFLFYIFMILYLLFDNHFGLMLIIYLLIMTAFILIIFIPSESKILSRIRISCYQIFSLEKVYDNSVRERTFLFISNLFISIMCPFLGMGYNGLFSISNVGSHNAFGSMSVNYGLISLLVIMYLVWIIYKRYKNGRNFFKYLFIYYFLAHTVFSFFYGTAFESRYYYFIFGIALAQSLEIQQSCLLENESINEKMPKKVVYFGNFSITNGFASVNRAIGISHLISKFGYQTNIYVNDLTPDSYMKVKNFDSNINLIKTKKYNKVLSYLIFSPYLRMLDREKPALVVLYDFPYIPAKKIINYCRQNDIKIIGDFTEWFDGTGYKGIFKFFKKLDSDRRIKKLPKYVDGSIVVSSLLQSTFEKNSSNPVIKIYPLMDFVLYESKELSKKKKDNQLVLSYIGNSLEGKDSINELIRALSNIKNLNFLFLVAGNFPLDPNLVNETRVKYFGMLNHQDALSMLLNSDYEIVFREPKNSNNAGFPSKIAESLSLGLPVITNIFSDLNLVLNNQNSYVISDLSLIEETMLLVVDDYKKNIIKAVPNETKEKFSCSLYIERFKEFLDKIIFKESK